MKMNDLEREFKHDLNNLKASGIWDPVGDFKAILNKHFSGISQITNQNVLHFQADIQERVRRIPLGHILGYTEFNGYRFVVGTGVFVPRQQSTMLLDWLHKNVDIQPGALIYDLCSGSGAIGVSAWKQHPNTKVVCVENDDVAYQYLCRNINRLASEEHVIAKMKDITNHTDFVDHHACVDVMISNPPYVPNSEDLLPEWQQHHPVNAIYSGQGGNQMIEASISLAESLLKPGGTILIEHGEFQKDIVKNIFKRYQFHSVETHTSHQFSDETGLAVMTTGTKQ
ncbi:peptide chain release factor N(5)-glutamine methyltransferase [Vibrio sp. Of7-15]|uniref:N5-glutamine methyltransferase family protein n=1 Tax=Vibrio sp. Of7-15 TaxID=2724879 RepID=UPI001EF20B9F|nr:HemK/PrmC family methyltransferase [Vibrio sp. Of7-15]MCG7498974.1 peptide chain release factor N(5)-glutamine methyltransferase [Vibrio sp. Of7-15]